MNWLTVLFCNCCQSGCDCGCVEDCRLPRHRAAASKPCGGTNANVCVAEGCYGEACLTTNDKPRPPVREGETT